MRRSALILAIILAGVALLSSCGGNVMVSGSDVTPAVTSISPASAPAGSGNFPLALTGTGLGIASQVHFGGDLLTPNSVAPASCPGMVNCETIVVTVPAKDVSAAGPIRVFVTNGPLASNAMAFSVTTEPPNGTGAPTLLTVAPLATMAGGPAFPLTLTAANVGPAPVVNFGSLALSSPAVLSCNPDAFCSLTVQVPASAITIEQKVSVTVTNPGAVGGTSNGAGFLIIGAGEFPLEQSVSAANVPGNGPSTHSSVSIGGVNVAFDSTATNLISGVDSGLSQVYLRHNCFGATVNCTATTTLVSAAPDGSPGAGGVNGSDEPVMSSDGRFIVYESDDTNLVPDAMQPVEQIYLFDTCQSLFGPVAGCAPGTTLVSAAPDGAPGNAASANPVISVFGFIIAFQSAATNLTGATVPSGVQQIYLRVTCNLFPSPGCMPANTLVSADASGNPGDRDSTHPSLDGLGSSIAFQSLADNIVAGVAGNGFQQIYLRSDCFPAASAPDVCPTPAQLISVDSAGALGTADSIEPVTGLGGDMVLFASRAPNLLPANTASQQILARNTCLNLPAGFTCAPSTQVVSVGQNGMPGQGDSSNPSLGARGVVTFTSLASLVSGVTGQQVYATGPCVSLLPGAACLNSPVVVSTNSSGAPIGGDHAAVDFPGLFVAFSSAGGAGASAGTPESFLAAPFLLTSLPLVAHPRP